MRSSKWLGERPDEKAGGIQNGSRVARQMAVSVFWLTSHMIVCNHYVNGYNQVDCVVDCSIRGPQNSPFAQVK